jgi:hypothetical protein
MNNLQVTDSKLPLAGLLGRPFSQVQVTQYGGRHFVLCFLKAVATSLELCGIAGVQFGNLYAKTK